MSRWEPKSSLLYLPISPRDCHLLELHSLPLLGVDFLATDKIALSLSTILPLVHVKLASWSQALRSLSTKRRGSTVRLNSNARTASFSLPQSSLVHQNALWHSSNALFAGFIRLRCHTQTEEVKKRWCFDLMST